VTGTMKDALLSGRTRAEVGNVPIVSRQRVTVYTIFAGGRLEYEGGVFVDGRQSELVRVGVVVDGVQRT